MYVTNSVCLQCPWGPYSTQASSFFPVPFCVIIWLICDTVGFICLPSTPGFLQDLDGFKDNLHSVKILFVLLNLMPSDKCLKWHIVTYDMVTFPLKSFMLPFVIKPYTHLHSNPLLSQIIFFFCSLAFSRRSHKLYNFGKLLATISSNVSFPFLLILLLFSFSGYLSCIYWSILYCSTNARYSIIYLFPSLFSSLVS